MIKTNREAGDHMSDSLEAALTIPLPHIHLADTNLILLIMSARVAAIMRGGDANFPFPKSFQQLSGVTDFTAKKAISRCV